MLDVQRWFLNNSLRNYQHLLTNGTEAIVIDPLRADICLEKIQQQQLTLQAILITHRHGDHIAGVEKLKQKFPQAKVFAYADNERFAPDVYVEDTKEYSLGFAKFRALYTPGHIDDHICYVFDNEKALFCGDTLFNAGVGGVQAASASIASLYESIKKISALDDNIRIYPAHDYWASNLDFALSILPNDKLFNYYRSEVAPLPADKKLVTTISEERGLNIFMRSFNDESLKEAIENTQLGQEMFTKLRIMKNNF